MRVWLVAAGTVLALVCTCFAALADSRADEIRQLGSRRELFVDEHLIAGTEGVELRLHRPRRGEVVFRTDKPWEGNMCGYVTVFEDDDTYRMYYKGWDTEIGQDSMELSPLVICYAESEDGVHWHRPELGIFEFDGSKKNNIVWKGAGPGRKGVHGFAPFKDENPECDPDARYKAVGAMRRAGAGGLYAMQSPDGIHWSLMQEEPVMTRGAFDSQNLAFWDSAREEYRAYIRDFRKGHRDIKTATSQEFVHWAEPEWLSYPDAPREQLYTNQVIPYFRAPHILVGFPTRYVEEFSPCYRDMAGWEHRELRMSVSRRYGSARTDGLFMCSRDRRTFRRWNEAFLRPGPDGAGRWVYGDNYQCWGLIETNTDDFGPQPELSFYATEGYWRGGATDLRRYSIRLDGFVSAHASLDGGTLVTRAFTFEGDALELNYSTSAAGSVRVEIQKPSGEAIPGFGLQQSRAMIGDTTGRTVKWQDKPDMGKLAGRPIRVRFELKDADLYAFQFVNSSQD